MKQLGIALLGMGRIGRLHGENLAFNVPQARLVIAADAYLNDSMKEWADSVGVDCTNDVLAAINHPEVDAVFICTSTAAHAELIKAAAAAGKHIFCEKPIHTDLDQIKEAIADAENAGVKLQVGFVRRFDHNHKAVHDTVASGVLGKPHVVKVCSRDPDHQSMDYIKTSGGIFLDMTIHDFDMVRYLSCGEVTEVCAYGAVCSDAPYGDYDDIDTAIIMLKFDNGALGVIDNSRASHYGYDQRTEVQCDKGCVRVDNDLENTAQIASADGVSVAKPTWFFLERYNNAFIAEARAFCDSVLKDTPVLVNGKDGLMPVAIAMAAAKSYRENRSVLLSEILG